MNILPLFYFKTTVVCLDDNIIIPLAIKHALEESFEVKIFSDVAEFANNICEYVPKIKLDILNEFDAEYNNVTQKTVIELDLNKILKIANIKDKFQEISVLVIDYIMPVKNGIEICKELKQHKYKKLLLTASKDYQAGLNAMNQNVIDIFLDKNDSSNDLISQITNLSYDYFNDLTLLARRHLEVNEYLPLSDKVFIDYFLNFMNDNKIYEYYLIDKIGSLLLVDNKGQKSVLVVHTNSSLDEFIKNFGDIDEISEIIEQIKQRKQIPWLGIGIDSFKDATELKQVTYQPKALLGQKDYFVCHINHE
ncbi:MAG: hypothetical protein PHC75_02250 [Burkholderiales bacterium]|nr:hypothetical protein [Burkholderiales bacterium]